MPRQCEKSTRIRPKFAGPVIEGALLADYRFESFARKKGTAFERLTVQVLQTDRPLPAVRYEADVVVPRDDEPAITITAPINADDGDWLVVRITDPTAKADDRAPAGSAYASAGRAIAYASPFYLRPPG